MDTKYIVDQYDNVIFIGTPEECLKELETNPKAVAIRDTRYRKSAIEMMAMRIAEKRPKKVYSYDIWDGDKGIIFANSEEEAKQIYERSYDEPICDEDYESHTCQIEYVCDVPDESKIVFMYE